MTSALRWIPDQVRDDDDERSCRAPAGRWRCNSGTAVTEAALAGHGVCQLPDFYVMPHL